MNKLIVPFSTKIGGNMNISIFGSCVSRDIFNYIKGEDDIKLIKYYARSSIISVTSKTLNKSIHSIDLKSKFQRKMVYNDINKLFWGELIDNEIDILLLDFIDERLDVIKISEDQYLTRSNEFNSTVEFKKKFKGSILKEEDRLILWKNSINIFINNIIKKMNEDRIFINECYYCEKYIDENGEEKYFENQEYIKKKIIY